MKRTAQPIPHVIRKKLSAETQTFGGNPNMICGKESMKREEVIARYLARSLDVSAVEEFEGHYLGCDECFDELRVSERLAVDLRVTNLSWKQNAGVSILQFRTNAELTQSARELDQLRREVLE